MSEENKEVKPRIWIGCDPGKSGAIVCINEIGACFWTHIPIVADEISIVKLKEFFWSVIEKFTIEMCIVEDVHSIFGSSAKANFEFGRSLGILEAMVASLEIPWVKVAPKTWQKLCHQGVTKLDDKKKMSLLASQRLLPGNSFLTNESLILPTKKAVKPHDGIVDAALISYYCRQNYTRQNLQQ